LLADIGSLEDTSTDRLTWATQVGHALYLRTVSIAVQLDHIRIHGIWVFDVVLAARSAAAMAWVTSTAAASGEASEG
jgi:hypothetical protein